ncbi:hypothetical protein ACSNOI_26005 [Actinomadura kijaniata]|uniref:hypothetical protein n=1 Tax=Actinomadura kijaniata TaxID=46161 RepID=UPI003F1BC293
MVGASLDELLAWLVEGEPRVRESAAAYLGDRLAQDCRAGLEVSAIVVPLVEALARETDPAVQEEIAHSLGYLVEYGTVPRSVVRPLRECLPRLHAGAAEHVADVLGAV